VLLFVGRAHAIVKGVVVVYEGAQGLSKRQVLRFGVKILLILSV
jgi:hypothetical protein